MAAHVVEIGLKAPVLESSFRDDWISFKEALSVYYDKGGRMRLSKMISTSASQLYSLFFKVDNLGVLSDEELELKIDK